jgi:uncharacterized protein YbcI
LACAAERKQRVDGGPVTVLARSDRQPCVVVLDLEVMVGGRDEDLPESEVVAVGGLTALQRTGLRQDVSERARARRRNTQDDADGRSQVGGQAGDHDPQRVDTPGGGADHHETSATVGFGNCGHRQQAYALHGWLTSGRRASAAPLSARIDEVDLQLAASRRLVSASRCAYARRRPIPMHELSTSSAVNGDIISSANGAPAGTDVRARSPLLQISNAMVRLYKEAFGRGPTKARAHFIGSDTLIVVLEDSLTVMERKQLAIDRHARLREARLEIQDAMEHELRAAVEDVLGRRTLSFISGVDPRHDISIELFTLEPEISG